MQAIKDKYEPLIQNAGKEEKERLTNKLEAELTELEKAKN